MKDTFQITTEVIKGECAFRLKNGHLFDFRDNPEEITTKLVHRKGLDDWNIEIYKNPADSSKVFYLIDRSRIDHIPLTNPKQSVVTSIENQKDHPNDVIVFLSCEIPIGSKCVSNPNKNLVLTDTILITDEEIDQYIYLK